MRRKLLTLCIAILAMVLLVTLMTACDAEETDTTKKARATTAEPDATTAPPTTTEPVNDFKLGVILFHDENSTYDLNFIEAVKRAAEELGLDEDQIVYKKNIPESNTCYEVAEELVELGCDVIFANSFGHEAYLLKAAKEFPKVQFCHAAGTMAHTEELDNYHNAFASIYEGRYLTGVAAGLKLNEMIANGEITAAQAKMGYVGAFPFAEVISSYTSFYLGAKSVCPTVTMDVQFAESWYDYDLEKNAANALIDRDCVLISQYAESMGAPTACAARGVPNITYNGSTKDSCPDTYIISSKIDWTPYFIYICKAVMEGTEIATDWTGTIKTGSVLLVDLNEDVAAAGTAATLEAVKAQLVAGTLHVFDTDTFTVGGVKLNSYKADVDTDTNFVPDTEVIFDGYFHESEKRSAPYFDIQIDGITVVNPW